MSSTIARVATFSRRSPIVRRWAALAALPDADLELLNRATDSVVRLPAGTELVAAGQPVAAPRLLVDGWACQVRSFPDGRRQILSFCLPGEMVGLYSLQNAPSPCSWIALTFVELADASRLCQLMSVQSESAVRLSAACRHSEWLQHGYLLSQIARIGRLTAYERLAHLLLEFHSRLKLSGLVDGYRFRMPLTQEIMADALGLSVVHVNRTLQQLRRDHLIESHPPFITLTEPALMAVVADFSDPCGPLAEQNGPGRRLHFS